jgi:hypothetical protein
MHVIKLSVNPQIASSENLQAILLASVMEETRAEDECRIELELSGQAVELLTITRYNESESTPTDSGMPTALFKND